MDVISGLLSGFQNILHPDMFFYCLVGVFIGTLVGVLPGIGPIGAMSMLLPATYGISPTGSIIMLAGIYYGCMYGGSTTSILVNIPGEASSVITCLDGYQMAKKGRAGPALGISAMGSFIGGTVAIIGLMFLAFPLARAALKFGAPEFFSVMVLAMTILAYMAVRSAVNAFLMILVGLILGCVGMDPVSGIPRFFFGSPSLLDGIGVVPAAMGLFGVSEVFSNIGVKQEREILKTKIKNILPNLDDWKKSIGPIWRGSIIGFFLGILPGAGSIMSTFVSYTMEKKLSRRPEEFGKGAIEGVAGPETANNAGAGGAFVPMLALGIPPTAVMALLLSALIIHGVTPGPLLLKQHPEIFWGVIASMYMGNLALLVLNLPLVGLWVQVLKIPSKLLLPLILLICLAGVYTINNNVTDIVVMTIFGVAGYILRRAGYELAPLIMALVLGPLMETNWRSALILSDGSLSIFVTRPISVTCLVISVLLLLSTAFTTYRRAKKRVVEEAGEGD